jgi:hypothetical protein
MEETDLVEIRIKLSDVIRANRSRITNPKTKERNRRRNRLARKHRRLNLKRGSVAGRQ